MANLKNSRGVFIMHNCLQKKLNLRDVPQLKTYDIKRVTSKYEVVIKFNSTEITWVED